MAVAQDAGDEAQAKAETLVGNARAAFAPEPERKKPRPCPESVPGEIIVCARMQEEESLRVPHEVDGSADMPPRAPDLAPPPCKPSLLSLCITMGASVRQFEPPVDSTSLPEPVDFPVGRAD